MSSASRDVSGALPDTSGSATRCVGTTPRGMTLHELAAEYGVSAERIRQIEVAALKKMHKTLEPQRV